MVPSGTFYGAGGVVIPWAKAYSPAKPLPSHEWNPRSALNLASATDVAARVKDAIQRRDFAEYKRNGGYFEEIWWL